MTEISRWTVGDATVTAVVESQFAGVPTEMFFPGSTAADIASESWLVPARRFALNVLADGLGVRDATVAGLEGDETTGLPPIRTCRAAAGTR